MTDGPILPGGIPTNAPHHDGTRPAFMSRPAFAAQPTFVSRSAFSPLPVPAPAASRWNR